MSYVPYLSNAVDIFGKPSKDIGFKDGFDHLIRPNTLQNNSIEFRLEPDQIHYLKTDQTLIYCRFKVTKNGGKNLEATDNVAPVNFFPAALFSTCEIYCNDIRLTGASPNSLPYKRYLETIASYGVDARESHLQLAMFNMDTAGHFEAVDENAGFNQRKKLIAESKSCEFSYWLQLDILNIDKLFPNGMKLSFVFERNAPEWCLMEKDLVDTPAVPKQGNTPARPAVTAVQNKYEITIEDMHMQVRKVSLTDNIMIDHEKEFSKNKLASYPYTSSLIKKFSIQKGQTTEYFPAAFSGKLPTQVLLVMNETAADLGNYHKNPFNFQHFNLSRASLTVDGQLKREYRVNFANQFDELLAAFYQNIAIHNSNTGVVIDKDYFKGGCSIVTWNLTGDKSNFMINKQGTIDLELEFSQALPEGVTVIMLALYDDMFQIDTTRSITLSA